MLKKTKIVATIGPASWEPDVLKQMVEAGLNVARVNASFADAAEIERVSKLVRSVSDEMAVMVDIKGPKIRINDFGDNDETYELVKGEEFVLGPIDGDEKFWATYKGLSKDVKPGSVLLIADGKFRVDVVRVEGDNVITKVINGGKLTRGKTINTPGTHLNFPILSEKDKEDILKAVEIKADYIAGSFIRTTDDVKAIRELMEGSESKLIAKIEDPEGVDNFDEILDIVDGVMVARGDLGVELPAEKVPPLQKQFIKKCNRMGKPVIVATQMLESMIESATPTRAEVNDVANAIYDGADAVMLSAEASVGKHPIEAVRVMTKIAREIEPLIEPQTREPVPMAKPATNAVAKAAISICETIPIDKILVASSTGTTARTIARNRPRQDIYAFTKNNTYKHRLAMFRGIQATVFDETKPTRDEAIKSLARNALEKGFVTESDLVLIVAGSNILGQGAANLMEIQRVGNVLDE